jgi:CRP/FNR family transcriptional regulator
MSRSMGTAVARDPDLPPQTTGGLSVYESSLGRFGKLLRQHQLSFTPVRHTIRPRRNIYIGGEASEHTYVVCEGWACRVARLFDGRRQILSLLLPGDLFSATSPFQQSLGFYVEAITEVRYAAIENSELRAKLSEDPILLDSFMELCAAETNDAYQRLIDLGQRLAEERIALLILQLMERLEARGLVHEQSFDFPLRQLQIADAVGLTPVHVSRVMSLLRNSGLIEVQNGTLRILDLPKLQRIGGQR